jgi:hypothetical protein
VDPQVLAYLNRLSDLLWLFGRLLEAHAGVDSKRRDEGHAGTRCFRIGSKFRCIRSTPTEMQSMSDKDFECFASTGVNAPVTMRQCLPR